MTDATLTEIAPRLDVEGLAPIVYKAVVHLDQAVTRQLDAAAVDHKLRELVRIRASQLNGCAYCVDMHTKDARIAGETEQRLYAVPVWRETPFFTPRERAALAWTDAVTELGHGGDLISGVVRRQLGEGLGLDRCVGHVHHGLGEREGAALRRGEERGFSPDR